MVPHILGEHVCERRERFQVEIPTLAFHSCSVETAAEVIKSGGLKTGVAASDGAVGVYCEGEARKTGVSIYGAHTLLEKHKTIATCAILELCVDRVPTAQGVRRTVREQWVQQEDRVFIVGVYTHLFPIAQLYAPGFTGWYRIHDTVFETLHILQVDENGAACNESDHDPELAIAKAVRAIEAREAEELAADI